MSNPMPKTGAFCWNELMTPDANKAKEFYKKLLNWEFKTVDVGDQQYTMIKPQGAECEAGGIMQIPDDQKGQIPPHWMSYIYVENLDESIEKARSLGAEIKKPATQAGEFGRFAVILDPTGAHFALWQSSKTCG